MKRHCSASAAKATALGVWKGHHSKAWRTTDHLAVPWQGHPRNVTEPL